MADTKRPPAKSPAKPAARAKSGEVDAFLASALAMAPTAVDGRGRLIFALDATMSRQPTWDTALKLQAEMFEEAGKVGGLDIHSSTFVVSTNAAPVNGSARPKVFAT